MGAAAVAEPGRTEVGGESDEKAHGEREGGGRGNNDV